MEPSLGIASPAVSLRTAGTADFPFLEKVYAALREEELSATDWTAEAKADFCHMQHVAQDTHYRQFYPTARFFVIEDHGAAIGRLYLDHWSREIRIMDIALLPEYRGRGIGTHLLSGLMKEAAAAEKTLSIHVERFNPALQLYLRLGFVPVEDKGVHLLMEWRPGAAA